MILAAQDSPEHLLLWSRQRHPSRVIIVTKPFVASQQGRKKSKSSSVGKKVFMISVFVGFPYLTLAFSWSTETFENASDPNLLYESE